MVVQVDPVDNHVESAYDYSASSSRALYLSVVCFKSKDQNPTVNPPFRPPEGAQLKLSYEALH
jgi:hypothetical protein